MKLKQLYFKKGVIATILNLSAVAILFSYQSEYRVIEFSMPDVAVSLLGTLMVSAFLYFLSADIKKSTLRKHFASIIPDCESDFYKSCKEHMGRNMLFDSKIDYIQKVEKSYSYMIPLACLMSIAVLAHYDMLSDLNACFIVAAMNLHMLASNYKLTDFEMLFDNAIYGQEIEHLTPEALLSLKIAILTMLISILVFATFYHCVLGFTWSALVVFAVILTVSVSHIWIKYMPIIYTKGENNV